MSEKSVYFIRHGQSEANIMVRFGLDLPLSEKGIEQAIAVQERFKDRDKEIGLVVCSDMKRAVETAFRAFPDRNTIVVDRRFREINFGKLEGACLYKETLLELQYKPELIFRKYKGDNIWDRANKALDALEQYVRVSEGDVVLVGHDTLFELMLQAVGYYEIINGGEKPFVLWADHCRFPNGGSIKVNERFLSPKSNASGKE